ncbi:MAG: tetratricopeptide repeat protein [Saprospiraceae bacterium]|nr:tetratricopeptide repeat protein [Saprospiraceae bacterium]
MYLKNIIFFTGLLSLFHCRQTPDSGRDVAGDARIQILDKTIDEHPFEDSLYSIRANYYYEHGLFDQAVQDIQYAIKLDSLQPAYYHLLADIFLDKQQSYEALNSLYQASQLFPRRVATLLKLCEFQYILKQYEASLKTIQIIQGIEPLNAESFFMAGLNYRDLKDTMNALSALKYATSLDDRHVDAWIVAGQLTQSTDPSMALSYFENAVRVDTTNILSLHSLAGFYQNQMEYKKSLSLYRKIIEMDPTYADAFVHTGMIYFNLDSFAQALNSFDILCRLEATNPDYSYYRGTAHEALGNIPAARLDYQQSLRLDPLHAGAKAAFDLLK